MIKKMGQPSWNDLEAYADNESDKVNKDEIKNYLHKNEYSYRKMKQCMFLQLEYPEVWKQSIHHREEERKVMNNLHGDKLIEYIRNGYHPEPFINSILTSDSTLQDYGTCLELSGSLWAFLGSALYKRDTTPKSEEE
jgi:hypothetical protein